MKAPSWLHPDLFMQRITVAEARVVGLEHPDNVDGQHLYPQVVVLPMGWALSVYFCQAAHENVLFRSQRVSMAEKISDF